MLKEAQSSSDSFQFPPRPSPAMDARSSILPTPSLESCPSSLPCTVKADLPVELYHARHHGQVTRPRTVLPKSLNSHTISTLATMSTSSGDFFLNDKHTPGNLNGCYSPNPSNISDPLDLPPDPLLVTAFQPQHVRVNTSSASVLLSEPRIPPKRKRGRPRSLAGPKPRNKERHREAQRRLR